MASRTVDVVARGPPSADPYDPAAPAWALAAAFAARGDHTSVLFPAGGPEGVPPPGVRSVPVALPLRRPGAVVEGAEFAGAAGARLRPHVELVIRDPVGLGRIARGRPGSSPAVAGFVRELALASVDRDHAARTVAGLRDRVDRWRDRRAVRRLEEAALREAGRLFYDDPDVRSTVGEAYAIPESKFLPSFPAVALLPEAPSRDGSRATFRIPPDVPVVVAPAATSDPAAAGIDAAREAFRRVRSFFPGARLIVSGCDAPNEPGVVAAPGRDRATLATALACADVALFLRPAPGFDPGVVLAMRAGLSVIAGCETRLAIEPDGAIRKLASDDPGDAASVLAELLADPAGRRALATAARPRAAPFDPTRVAEQVASQF
jgi:hypothetical protein